MPNKFQLKRTAISGRSPNTTNSSNTQYIDAGELAINLTDQILYSSDGSSLIQLTGSGTPVYDETGTLINTGFVTLATLSNTGVDIIPGSDNTYSLGNTTNGFANVFVDTSVIVGNTTVKTTVAPTALTLGGTVVANGGSGSAGQVLTSAGAGSNAYWSTVSGGSGTPSGANTQVQFNDSGAFGGDSFLTFDKVTDVLAIGNTTVNTQISSANTVLGGDLRVTGNNSIHLGGTRSLSIFYIQYNSTNNSIDFILT